MRSAALILMISSIFAHCADNGSEIPRIERPPVEGDFGSAQTLITGGPWTLGQAWREDAQPGLQPGLVRFAWEPQGLWVLAELTDDFVASRSTDHGENLWEMGDVFEVFVAREGADEYAELHVSPNNHRLSLRWPQGTISDVRGGTRPLANFVVSPAGFSSWVRASPAPLGWGVLVLIPSDLIPGATELQAGDALELSFSRYDLGPAGTKKILSSTSPFRELDFHRRQEWHHAVLAPPSPSPGR